MYKAVLVLICAITVSFSQNCGEDGTMLALKKPIYDFSVRFLHRISYGITDHFVYSPLSTWLQLVTLVEGAQEETLNEIWEVTGLKGYRKKTCYRRKFKQILNDMESSDKSYKRSSIVIIDKLFKVQKQFQSKIEALKSVNMLSLDFDDPDSAAEKANDVIEKNVNGEIEPVALVIPDDFDKRVLLMSDLAYFRSVWQHPFIKARTKSEPFYTDFERHIIGTVDMMNQVGYFKLMEIPLINARVLELPFADNRTSMLIYLPMKGRISEIYYLLKDTTLTGVLNALKMERPKAVNVSLPKFAINTEIANIADLLYDMGVKRAFYPESAQLSGITDSGAINVSFMSQVAAIEVTESHVTAEVENLIANPGEATTEFNGNKPFAFMLVDKKTELILFAGMFSKPSESESYA